MSDNVLHDLGDFLKKNGMTREKLRDLICAEGKTISISRINHIATGARPSVKIAKVIEKVVGYPAARLLGVEISGKTKKE